MKAKIGRGSGFRGVLDYALGKGEAAEIVGGNMAGTDPQALAAEFGLVRQLRPECARPVSHVSLSLPVGERLTPGRWDTIGADFMTRMGMDPARHPYVIIRHTDRGHEHAHIIASRIALDGFLWLGQWEARRAITATQQIEREHGLTLTPGLDDDPEAAPEQAPTRTGRKTATQPELERADRTGEAPARLRLQEVIDQATADGPSVLALLDRLDAAGVTTTPNIASTGKLNGFAFAIDGVSFKGSQLGKRYSWQGLQARGVTYESDRESADLRARADRARAGGRALDGGDAADLGRALGPAGVGHGAPDRGAGHSDVGPHGDHGAGGGGSLHPRDDVDAQDRGREGGHVDRSGEGEGGDLDPGGIGDDDGRPGEGPHGLTGGGYSGRDGEPGREALPARDAGPGHPPGLADWGPVADRVADLASAVHPGPVDPLDVGVPVELTPALRAKAAAWEEQHRALGAPAYRLTLKSRVDGLVSFNVGKGRGPGGTERTYTAEEVRDLLPYLSAQNARGRDVYLTPLDQAQHFLLLDDATPDSLAAFLASGYRPALVQQSSADNMQAVLRVAREAGPDEQRAANALLGEINTRFGDPKISGAIRPFRMAGFSNRKPGRGGAFTRILEAVGGWCERTTTQLAAMRERFAEARTDRVRPVAPSRPPERLQEPHEGFAKSDAAARFAERRAVHVRVAEAQGWTLDDSRLDYRAALDLARASEDPRDVAAAILARSPGIYERHPSDPEGYARRTAEAVARKVAEVGVEMTDDHKDEPPQGPQGP